MNERIVLATSNNGIAVTYDPEGSHFATHLADTPQLAELVTEVINSTDLTNAWQFFHTDLGRVIGMTDEVTNESGDEIVYAKRLNRDVYTSFNKTQEPHPCQLLSTAFKRISDTEYDLFSAYIGRADSPPFPGEPNASADSIAYWTTHSLCWGSQAIQAATSTTVCPWVL